MSLHLLRPLARSRTRPVTTILSHTSLRLSRAMTSSSSNSTAPSRFVVRPSSIPKRPLSEGQTRPDHWMNEEGTKFKNPWTSYREPVNSPLDILGLMNTQRKASPLPPNAEIASLIPVHKPSFGLDLPTDKTTKDGVKVTWLGHACFFVEFPTPPGASRGVRVLFDPVFSDRCSPVQWAGGPRRFTPPPTTVASLPPFDLLILSHNHYDHLDTPTLRQISALPNPPHVILPLNTTRVMLGEKTGFEKEQMSELDWWEGCEIGFKLPAEGEGGKEGKEEFGTVEVGMRVTGAPAQHMTARGLWDKAASLWSSFVLEPIPSSSPTLPNSSSTASSSPNPSSAPKPLKFWFAGDTGYSSLPADAGHSDHTLYPESTHPVCPAFKEMGERWGGFDLSLIPIGAYDPRWFMSPLHTAPIDSVRIFRDVKAKKAIGMHWGVWRLTTEPIDEPVRRLAEAREVFGISEDEFNVMEIGSTRVVNV